MFRRDEDYEYFADYVRRRSRYVLNAEQHEFIEAILQTSKTRTKTMPAGQILWRAAQGYVYKPGEEGVHPHDVFFLTAVAPHPVERMTPLKDSAKEGRVNPKGIPCLYTATDPETAMMETRPWAGSVLTVSQLVLLKQIALVDCTLANEFELVPSPTQAQLESNSWHVLNEAFSQPVFDGEMTADYAPTQYIAEAFRTMGYGGIIYTSKVGPGTNVAVFDVNAAEVASRQLRQVKSVSFTFRSVTSPSYVEKYSEELSKMQEPAETQSVA
jgi:RES domain-containing protein